MSKHVRATGRHIELTRCQVFFGKNRGIDVRIDVARRQQDQGAAQSVQPDRETGVAHPTWVTLAVVLDRQCHRQSK